MTLVLTADFHERAQGGRADRLRQEFKAALISSGYTTHHGRPAAEAASREIDRLWGEGRDGFGLRDPVSIVKYVLVLMTQSRWRLMAGHYVYARRMIGTPARTWTIESGIAAVYQNVVAAHHLGPDMVAFVADREERA